MAQISNNIRVRYIADALEELNDSVVYVGGSIAQYYSGDPASVTMQTTYDVDCVIDVTSYGEYTAFQESLYRKHFKNDQTDGAPVCRFVHGEEIVDIMPKVYIPILSI